MCAPSDGVAFEEAALRLRVPDQDELRLRIERSVDVRVGDGILIRDDRSVQ
jgi:hypothetical protein